MKNNSTDTQVVEAIGKNLLINELLICAIEVANPIRDRGVDLIAYNERGAHSRGFQARPLQLKTYSNKGFSLDKKYSKINDLLIVYIWNVINKVSPIFIVLTYKEALKVGDELGWTKNPSWTKTNGRWSTSRCSKKLENLLMKYRVNNKEWNLVLSKRN